MQPGLAIVKRLDNRHHVARSYFNLPLVALVKVE